MNIENKYLNYEEYLAFGGILQSLPFKTKEYKAEKIVDLYTQNRFSKITEFPNELKMCIFDLINLLETDDSSLTNESIGDYSITSKGDKEREKAKREVLISWLSNVEVEGVPVLFNGI